MEFVKAHGTGNDFVVVEDLADHYQLTPELVRAVCDRHFGVGADGLIRIAPGTDAPFFMDYRNADGSLAEMCGNGVRVVGKYLGDRGLVSSSFDLETRDGFKFFLEDGSWLLIRASGTEPLVRVYTEATSAELRDALLVAGEALVRGS